MEQHLILLKGRSQANDTVLAELTADLHHLLDGLGCIESCILEASQPACPNFTQGD